MSDWQEWNTQAHVERRSVLVEDARIAARALDVNNCDRCDPDVGFVCECCYARQVLREAANYLEAMNK